MEYSIIIPTYKIELEKLKKCIFSVLEYTDTSQAEIIVVANGQTQEVVNFLRELPNIKLLYSELPLGFAKAVNWGIKESSGELVVLLNDDCILLPQFKNQWLETLKEPFLTNSNMGITGVLTNYVPELQLEFLVFFCVMIKRQVIESIGYLDEGFLIGAGEDADYCLRAIKNGYLIQCVDKSFGGEGDIVYGYFPIYHEPDTTVKQIPEFPLQFQKNFKRLVSKWSFDDERLRKGRYEQIESHDALRWFWLRSLILDFIKTNGYKPTVIEIGCGTGCQLQIIGDDVGLYIGIDKDAKAIEFAQIDWEEDKFIFEVKDYETEIVAKKWKPNKKADFVICFEVLEHCENFKSALNHLFEIGDNIVITVPYQESPGYWGPYHKHWGINESWFPFANQNNFWYQTFKGEVYHHKPKDEIRNLYVFIPNEQIRKFPQLILHKPKILAYTSTKNRYWTTLPLTIYSVAMQTIPPDKYIILDDGEHLDLRGNYLYQSLFQLLDEKNILWEVIFTPNHGQTKNHQLVNKQLGLQFDWCWRIDDDEVADPKTIERFIEIITQYKDKNIGAVGFSVRVPKNGKDISKLKNLEQQYALKFCDLALPNIQMQYGNVVVEVEHLYSSFFYKPNIVDYNIDELSIVGHTEETQFSYDLFQKGYTLLVDLSLTCYHFQQPQGGIRSFPNKQLWEQDIQKFYHKYQHIFTKFFLICNPNGLGDNLVMAKVIQENPDIFDGYEPMVATAFPQAYNGIKCKIVDLGFPVVKRQINPDEDNIYRYLKEHPNLNLYNAYLEYLKDIRRTKWQQRTIYGI